MNTPTNITEVILRVDELLKWQSGNKEILQQSDCGETDVVLNGAIARIKPRIGGHRVEFLTPSNHWAWEIGVDYPEMPGAIIAGLLIFQRIPNF